MVKMNIGRRTRMLKILLFLSLSISTATFAELNTFGEIKQVTEDMIIGEWDCKNILNERTNYDEKGNMTDTQVLPSMPWSTYVAYQKKSGALMVQFDNQKPIKTDFKLIDETPFEPGGQKNDGSYDYESKVTEEYVFVSTNEFKLVSNIIIRDFISKKNNQIRYSELLCKRLN